MYYINACTMDNVRIDSKYTPPYIIMHNIISHARDGKLSVSLIFMHSEMYKIGCEADSLATREKMI